MARKYFTRQYEVDIIKGAIQIPEEWRNIFDEEEQRRTIFQHYSDGEREDSIICYPQSTFDEISRSMWEGRELTATLDAISGIETAQRRFFPYIYQKSILSRDGKFALNPDFIKNHQGLEKVVLIGGGNLFYVEVLKEGKERN